MPIEPEAMGLIQLIGAYLFLDDIDDFPEVDRVHHWQLGAGMMGAPYLRQLAKQVIQWLK
jgi:hypothetical protein